MKVTREATGGLRIVDFPFVFGMIAFPAALILLCEFATRLGHGAGPGRYVGYLIGAVACGTAGVVLTRRSEFRFDPLRRQVAWSRRGLLGCQRGILPFDQVRFAVVQCMPGGTVASYRVALHTPEGTVPLTPAYSRGKVSDDKCRAVRTAINEVLGVRLPSEDENDIREMVRSGERLWASAMAKDRYGYGATEASQFVEAIAK